MRRSWKITGGVLAATVVLAGVAVAVAPRLVHDRLENELKSAGYPNARVGRVGLGLWSAQISDVALDAQGTATIAAITASWHWSELAKGRLASLQVTGVRVVVAVGPGGPVLDPLRPQSDPARAAAPTSWPAELPVGRIEVDGSVRLGDRELMVTGLAQDLGAGRAWGEVVVNSDMGAITLSGQIDGGGLGFVGHVEATGLDVREMNAAAQPWMTDLPISGLRGRIDANADLTWTPAAWTCAGTITAAALAGSTPWFTLREATVRAAGRVAAEGGKPVMVGTLRVAPAELTLAVALPGQGVSVPSLVVTSDGRHLHVEVDLQAAGASLHLAGSGTSDLAQTSARITLKDLDLAAWQTRTAALLTVPTSLKGTASGTVQIEGLAGAVQGRGSLAVTALGVQGSGVVATADALAIEGEATLSGSDVRSAHAMVRVTNGAATVPAAGVVVSAMTGTLPWSLAGLGDVTGDLRADVVVAGLTLPGVRLRAQAGGRTISGRVDARVHDLITGTAEGTVTMAPEGLEADLRVLVPRTTLRDSAAVAAALPMLAPWTVTGDLGCEGTITLRRGVLVPALHLSLAEATIEQRASKLMISGLQARIDVVNFSPLTCAPRQLIEAERVSVGGQELTRLAGRVTLVGEQLTLDDGILGWGGGTVAIPSLNADLAGHSAQGDIQVRGVSLDAVCAAAAKDRVSAEGRLVGQMPVSITWPQVAVTLGAGRLEADPPSGWIRIADRAMITQAVGKGGLADADLRERLVDAVQEFAFTRLELVTSRDESGLLTKVRVVGKGRTGADPLELAGLVFNIRGVEEALAQALQLGQTAPAPADDTLDRFFGE